MPTAIDRFIAGPALDALRAKFNDPEFGYRMQALFGYVIAGLGARIEKINAHGHPDIRAAWHGKTALVQVKSLHHRYPDHRYKPSTEDLQGVTPQSSDQIGYLALLDCASPVEWIIVDECQLRPHLERLIHTVTLRADSDKELSRLCTDEFNRLIASFGDRLLGMSYALLCERAMALSKV